MPAAVEKCVSSLLAKWSKDPSSRPPPRQGGKDGKPQDAKSQAWAICQASYKKGKSKSLEIMLEDGYGPTLIGAAATNRPYIPRLEESRMEEIDGQEKLIVHLANPGFFNHPTGPFVLNHAVFSTIIHNFDSNILGQKAAYDSRHKPEFGALGWFDKLWLDEKGRLWGQVDPTPTGKDLIGGKSYLYSSMEFHRNYKRDDVKLDLEDATEDFCLLDMEDGYESDLEDLGYIVLGDNMNYELEENKEAIQKFAADLKKFLDGDGKVLDFGEHSGKAPPGMGVIDGHLVMPRQVAQMYMKLMGDKKELEEYLLFNPFHSKEDGKFTTKTGSKSGGSHKDKIKAGAKKTLKIAGIVTAVTIGAGVAFLAATSLAAAAAGATQKAAMDKAYDEWAKSNPTMFSSEDDDMTDEERVQLELELEEERRKRQEEQNRIKKLEKERDSAMEKALKLEQEAMDSAVAATVDLAVNHRDKNGNALPRVFAEWVKKVLSFDEFGEDEDVVKLEQEEKPGAEAVRYLTAAIRNLILEMPGSVPAQRKTQSGKGESDDEDFDYNELWDEKKGDE